MSTPTKKAEVASGFLGRVDLYPDLKREDRDDPDAHIVKDIPKQGSASRPIYPQDDIHLSKEQMKDEGDLLARKMDTKVSHLEDASKIVAGQTKEKIDNLADQAATSTKHFGEQARHKANVAKKDLDERWKETKERALDAKDKVDATAKLARDRVDQAEKDARIKLDQCWENTQRDANVAKQRLDETCNFVKNSIDETLQRVKHRDQDLKEQYDSGLVKEQLQAVCDRADQRAQVVKDSLCQEAKALKENIDATCNRVKECLDNKRNEVKDLGKGLRENLDSQAAHLRDNIECQAVAIKDQSCSLKDKIDTAVKDLENQMDESSKILKDTAGSLKSGVDESADGLKESAKMYKEDIHRVADELKEANKQKVEQFQKAVDERARVASDAIDDRAKLLEQRTETVPVAAAAATTTVERPRYADRAAVAPSDESVHMVKGPSDSKGHAEDLTAHVVRDPHMERAQIIAEKAPLAGVVPAPGVPPAPGEIPITGAPAVAGAPPVAGTSYTERAAAPVAGTAPVAGAAPATRYVDDSVHLVKGPSDSRGHAEDISAARVVTEEHRPVVVEETVVTKTVPTAVQAPAVSKDSIDERAERLKENIQQTAQHLKDKSELQKDMAPDQAQALKKVYAERADDLQREAEAFKENVEANIYGVKAQAERDLKYAKASVQDFITALDQEVFNLDQKAKVVCEEFDKNAQIMADRANTQFVDFDQKTSAVKAEAAREMALLMDKVKDFEAKACNEVQFLKDSIASEIAQIKVVKKEVVAPQPVETVVVERPTEKVVIERPPEQVVVEKPAEQVVVEKPAEQVVIEKPAEQVVIEKPAEQFVVEKPAEQVVVEKPAEQVVVEKPAEQVVLQKPAEQVVVEKPAEQMVFERPAEQAAYQLPADQKAYHVSAAAAPAPVAAAAVAPATRTHEEAIGSTGPYVDQVQHQKDRAFKAPITGDPALLEAAQREHVIHPATGGHKSTAAVGGGAAPVTDPALSADQLKKDRAKNFELYETAEEFVDKNEGLLQDTHPKILQEQPLGKSNLQGVDWNAQAKKDYNDAIATRHTPAVDASGTGNFPSYTALAGPSPQKMLQRNQNMEAVGDFYEVTADDKDHLLLNDVTSTIAPEARAAVPSARTSGASFSQMPTEDSQFEHGPDMKKIVDDYYTSVSNKSSMPTHTEAMAPMTTSSIPMFSQASAPRSSLQHNQNAAAVEEYNLQQAESQPQEQGEVQKQSRVPDAAAASFEFNKNTAAVGEFNERAAQGKEQGLTLTQSQGSEGAVPARRRSRLPSDVEVALERNQNMAAVEAYYLAQEQEAGTAPRTFGTDHTMTMTTANVGPSAETVLERNKNMAAVEDFYAEQAEVGGEPVAERPKATRKLTLFESDDVILQRNENMAAAEEYYAQAGRMPSSRERDLSLVDAVPAPEAFPRASHRGDMIFRSEKLNKGTDPALYDNLQAVEDYYEATANKKGEGMFFLAENSGYHADTESKAARNTTDKQLELHESAGTPKDTSDHKVVDPVSQRIGEEVAKMHYDPSALDETYYLNQQKNLPVKNVDHEFPVHGYNPFTIYHETMAAEKAAAKNNESLGGNVEKVTAEEEPIENMGLQAKDRYSKFDHPEAKALRSKEAVERRLSQMKGSYPSAVSEYRLKSSEEVKRADQIAGQAEAAMAAAVAERRREQLKAEAEELNLTSNPFYPYADNKAIRDMDRKSQDAALMRRLERESHELRKTEDILKHDDARYYADTNKRTPFDKGPIATVLPEEHRKTLVEENELPPAHVRPHPLGSAAAVKSTSATQVHSEPNVERSSSAQSSSSHQRRRRSHRKNRRPIFFCDSCGHELSAQLVNNIKQCNKIPVGKMETATSGMTLEPSVKEMKDSRLSQEPSKVGSRGGIFGMGALAGTQMQQDEPEPMERRMVV